MKAYTDFEQSKELAEILPIESADMSWRNTIFEGKQSNWFVRLSEPIKSDDVLPCWSLAALLSILPSVIKRKDKRMFLTLEKAGAYNLYYKSPDRLDELWETKYEAIDACYEMIIILHEQNLL